MLSDDISEFSCDRHVEFMLAFGWRVSKARARVSAAN